MLEREYDRPRLMTAAGALLCGVDRLMLPEDAAVASFRVKEADVELRLRIAGRFGRVAVFGDWESSNVRRQLAELAEGRGQAYARSRLPMLSFNRPPSAYVVCRFVSHDRMRHR